MLKCGTAAALMLMIALAGMGRAQDDPEAHRHGEDSYLIVSGQRVGEVSLGDTRARVWKTLGPPARTFTLPAGRTSDLWRYGTRTSGVNPPTLEVIYERGKVVQVETTSLEFHTGSDLSVNSASDEWGKMMGRPRATTYAYPGGKPRQLYRDWQNRGMALEIQLFPTNRPSNSTVPGYSEKVQTVIVHRPGVLVIPDMNGRRLK